MVKIPIMAQNLFLLLAMVALGLTRILHHMVFLLQAALVMVQVICVEAVE